MTYTAFKLNLDGSLSHKELLNNVDELNEWLANVYGKFASVKVTQDQTGVERIFTDNGQNWEKLK